MIFNQNCYYTFEHFQLDENLSKIPYNQNILATICVSEDSEKYLKFAFPNLPVYRIHLGIDNKVFKMNRLMNYCGKWIYHCGWYPDAKIRIFDRRFVYWIGDKVHETLYVPADFTCTKLNGNLLHYSFFSSVFLSFLIRHASRAD